MPAEAFHNAGFFHRDTGLAYFILGSTIGLDVSSTPLSVNVQRVQDAATQGSASRILLVASG
jgi:hypothetical protein